ncbi:hypothetical protein WOLCODRAFT_168120, partial [Wolfiporia cocos MD-104 SS10]
SGYSALSPDGRTIAVHNLIDGLHLYRTGVSGEQRPRRHFKFDVPPRTKHALRLAFLHQGQALVCGTTTGNVCIWETTTGEFYQQLAHDNDIVQTVAAYHRGDLSFVATASTGKGNNICVKIWRAKRAAGSPQDATETLFVATLLALEACTTSLQLIPHR